MGDVRVEVLVFSGAGGRLHYRSGIAGLADGRHPDDVAARLASAPAGPGGARSDGPQPGWAPPITVLHSTSWRYADGGVVLTYAAILDGHPDAAARPLPPHGIAHSGDAAAPSPPHICPDAVATHAARHLAWLRATDDVVATALAGLPHVWHCLDDLPAGPAGRLDPAPVATGARG